MGRWSGELAVLFSDMVCQCLLEPLMGASNVQLQDAVTEQ